MSWKLIDKPRTLKVTRKLALEYHEMDPRHTTVLSPSGG